LSLRQQDSQHWDLIMVPITSDVFGQGSAVTALPRLHGKAQVIAGQESSGETLMT
jgi:hypothetical protein